MSGDGIHRKEVPEIPIDAIREAVSNSFAHARYDLSVHDKHRSGGGFREIRKDNIPAACGS